MLLLSDIEGMDIRALARSYYFLSMVEGAFIYLFYINTLSAVRLVALS